MQNLTALLDAKDINAMDLYCEPAKQARPPAKALMAAKEDWAAEWIRKTGYDIYGI